LLRWSIKSIASSFSWCFFVVVKFNLLPTFCSAGALNQLPLALAGGYQEFQQIGL